MKVGIIGYGVRIEGMFHILKGLSDDVSLAAVADVDLEKVRGQIRASGMDEDALHFYERAEDMLDFEKLDGVMVGTRCNLHARYGTEVMRRGIPLFLEKPVATNLADLRLLEKTRLETGSPVVVSFPLRLTQIAQLTKEILLSGEIGAVQNVNAWNDVPYGGVYYHDWYRDEGITQGLFLQKSTHDFDLINFMLDLQPKTICAMNAKQLFLGDMPEGLHCSDCEKKYTCREGSWYIINKRGDEPHGDFCCFAKDTGNEDSGAAIVRYETGMIASYSRNFFARHQAGRRGMRLFGYEGTLEFDFYSDEGVKVYSHMANKRSVYKVPRQEGGHGGGDTALARNFLEVMRGEAKSKATLQSGILSALMCIRARESAEQDHFCTVAF